MAAAFGLGRHPSLADQPEHGRQGRVWRLTTTAGRFAIKLPYAAPDPRSVAADATYQDSLLTRGVRLPPVVRTPDGEVLQEIEGWGVVRVYGWADVCPPDRGLDPGAVGRTVAAVHAVEVPTEGPQHPWHTSPVGADQWRALADRSLAAGAPFGAQLAALVPEFVALEELISPPGPTRRCHCDLWADNVRAPAHDEGGLVVLDWENSGPADPVGELPMVMFEFGAGDPARMSALYAAYLTAGGTERLTGPGDCSMLIATIGHIVELGVLRWLNETDVRARASHAAWVAEGVDDPLTRAVVDEIVEAAVTVGSR
ncbi:hypothetical protein GCM10011366_21480 [Ornithinimicrobium tianjinense]|uniref:Aminoglycoside phosphotransferase domain-containing protein n=1 Tax=Ornithinimicrobium tianjinense TaxID=1195761 RepID=A0A917BP29_9MICO|nr:hypothetical protein GCM10011366_21480 [Ornithinimicrobium tianjinense]